MRNVEKRINTLREEVIKHDIAYAKGAPVITDTEYDRLYMELVELESCYPEFITKNSPTQKIYDIEVKGLKKVKHEKPMLSQDKINTEEGIEKFIGKENDSILVEEKLDGLTLVLTYQNGVLKQAVTRGNGYIGEDVTHIALNTTNIPKKIDFDRTLSVRAEALIPKEIFERINHSIVNPEERFKSARNLASGTVRNLSGSIAKKRGLKAIVYDIIVADGMDFKEDVEQLLFLKKLGFEVVSYELFTITQQQELKEYILNYNKKIRPTLSHDIDGLVLKFNNLQVREEMGYTSKYPRWGCAYKFESLDTTTKLLDVSWSVGKLGQITPNAILEPCEIDGVTISKASLANHDDILRRDLKIGDTVLVIRANDVIPKVVAPIIEYRTGTEKDIEMITHCPICGSPIEKDISQNGEEGVHLFCINTKCSAQLEGKIQHYASRNALNIDGLGDKTVEQLLEKNLITSIESIYDLKNHQDELLTLDKFGKKKITKLLDGIEDSKKAPLQNVLYGLSIRYVGENGAKRLAEHYSSMQDILELAKDKTKFYNDLLSIEDVGESTAVSVVNFFTNERNVAMIHELLNQGVTMLSQKVQIASRSNLAGTVFVITGTLSKSRKEIQAELESLGAKVSGSVSKKTNYLLMGDGEEGSSKHKKALELGTKIISERELTDMINYDILI